MTTATTATPCPICKSVTSPCGPWRGRFACFERLNGTPQGYVFERERADGANIYRALATNKPAPTTAVLQRVDGIKECPVSWLWRNRLELGALNLLAADPGSGKSLLTAALAAAITKGSRWPDARAEYGSPPRNVILVSSEDDPAKATRPRLRAAGADLSRVHILRKVVDDGKERALCLQRDLRAIEAAIATVGDVAMVVVDPLDSYLGKADSNANEEVRWVLEPLIAVAEKTAACLLVVKHLNKAIANPTALYRIGGSIAFVAVSRTVHIIGHDPDDKKRMIFAPLKISHGPRPDALAYRVEVDAEGLPVVQWEAESIDADADDLLAKKGTGRRETATDRAVTWLRDALAGGPMLSKDLDAAAHAAGIAPGTLKHAKERLGTVAKQIHDGQKITGWSVSLPTDRGIA
jgi:hypothetical protein